jgi:hypothetical protein
MVEVSVSIENDRLDVLLLQTLRNRLPDRLAGCEVRTSFLGSEYLADQLIIERRGCGQRPAGRVVYCLNVNVPDTSANRKARTRGRTGNLLSYRTATPISAVVFTVCTHDYEL